MRVEDPDLIGTAYNLGDAKVEERKTGLEPATYSLGSAAADYQVSYFRLKHAAPTA